jgi:hypothetical protein
VGAQRTRPPDGRELVRRLIERREPTSLKLFTQVLTGRSDLGWALRCSAQFSDLALLGRATQALFLGES